MSKLNPKNQIGVEEGWLTSILERYGISDFTFTKLTDGNANTTILIHARAGWYVLRIYAQERKELDEIELELRFMRFLKEQGCPVPAVLPTREGEGICVFSHAAKTWRAILMEFVEGQSKTSDHTSELIDALADLQARMHLLGVQFAENEAHPMNARRILRNPYAMNVPQISSQSQGSRAFIERARSNEVILSLNLPRGYNHLDFDLDGNVIVRDNQIVGVVDFDDVSYSPIAVCLGYSLWNVLFEAGEAGVRRYLARYERTRPLQDIERETLPSIIHYRNFVIGLVRLIKRNETEIGSRFLEIEEMASSDSFLSAVSP